MSGFTPSKRPVVTGITSKQTTRTPHHKLGSGAFKEVVMAQPANEYEEEFSFAELKKVGGQTYADYYAIVAVADFSASRLLSELSLQFDFSEVELLKLRDGTTITLSPKIFALRIQDKLRAFNEYYGKANILKALELLASSPDGDESDFLIAMERVNYDMGSKSVKIPAEVINAHHYKLIELINLVLAQGVLLTDIKVNNLSVKCSSSHSCELGVIDLDNKFVADVTRWYLLSRIGFTDAVHVKLAQQYMVLMVCFVGLNNGLTTPTKRILLKHVGLLSDDGRFNSAALNQMLQYEGLKNQIRHYLGFNHDTTPDIVEGFVDEYILAKEKTVPFYPILIAC